MHYRSLLLLLPVLLLAGCVTGVSADKATPEQFAKAVTRAEDPFQNAVFFTGALMTPPVADLGMIPRYWLGLAMSSRDLKADRYYVRFSTYRTYRTGWAFWSSAADDAGTPLQVRKVAQKVEQSAGTSETIEIMVARDYLEAIARGGEYRRIKVFGQNTAFVFAITPQEVRGFLSATDAARTGGQSSN